MLHNCIFESLEKTLFFPETLRPLAVPNMVRSTFLVRGFEFKMKLQIEYGLFSGFPSPATPQTVGTRSSHISSRQLLSFLGLVKWCEALCLGRKFWVKSSLKSVVVFTLALILLVKFQNNRDQFQEYLLAQIWILLTPGSDLVSVKILWSCSNFGVSSLGGRVLRTHPRQNRVASGVTEFIWILRICHFQIRGISIHEFVCHFLAFGMLECVFE